MAQSNAILLGLSRWKRAIAHQAGSHVGWGVYLGGALIEKNQIVYGSP